MASAAVVGVPDALDVFTCKGMGLLKQENDGYVEAVGDGVGGSRWDVHCASLPSGAIRTGNPSRRSLALAAWSELQRRRVHAVAEASGFGAVFKDVAQVAIAAGTEIFDTDHAECGIGNVFDIFTGDGGPETGPAGAGVELRFGVEENGIAANATVEAVGIILVEFAGEGAFSAVFAGDIEFDGREALLPFLIGLDDLVDFNDSLLLARGVKFHNLDFLRDGVEAEGG